VLPKITESDFPSVWCTFFLTFMGPYIIRIF
jgi:hypothetical protein